MVPSRIGDRGLVANWLFYNGAGDTLYDYSGKGNHGNINGAKWTDKEQAGWALDFDGVDDYVNIPDDRSLRIEGGLSISFWLYSQQDDISDWGWLLRKNTWPGNYYITDQGDGNTFFRVSDSDGNDYLVIASIIEYDTWIF